MTKQMDLARLDETNGWYWATPDVVVMSDVEEEGLIAATADSAADDDEMSGKNVWREFSAVCLSNFFRILVMAV